MGRDANCVTNYANPQPVSQKSSVQFKLKVTTGSLSTFCSSQPYPGVVAGAYNSPRSPSAANQHGYSMQAPPPPPPYNPQAYAPQAYAPQAYAPHVSQQEPVRYGQISQNMARAQAEAPLY